ncbi:MAG: cell division protein FtsH, partial [Alphaproteobacteria bacterium]|nr:cell division protein FtsH [Alphaproteobacteria bacterium]
ELTTGPSDDLQKAAAVARSMVMRFGMSEKIGPSVLGEREEMIFLGRELTTERNYSEETARTIDGEVRRIVDQGLKRAKDVIAKRRAKLEIIAKRLMEKETIERDEFEQLMAAPA